MEATEADPSPHAPSMVGVLVVAPRGCRAWLGSLLRGAQFLEVDPADALQRVQAMVSADLAGPRRLRAVCLIGADHELPMARLEDLSGYDEEVLTDNFYGRPDSPEEGAWSPPDLLPVIPVSRIPSTDPELIATVLRNGRGLLATWADGVAVSAAVWQQASQAVLVELLRDHRTRPAVAICPPTSASLVARTLGPNTSRAYFNVHGTDQEPVWVGEGSGGYPEVLRPHSARTAPRAVVLSEACYGAAVYEGEDAISLGFLRGGAGSFVGSTIIAWGHPTEPSCADQVAVGFFAALDAGATAAEALLAGKRRALEGESELSPPVVNTLLSFVHYGFPTSRVAGAPGQRSDADAHGAGFGFGGPPAMKGPGGEGSVLEAARARMAGQEPSALEGARERIRGRIPEDRWTILSRGRQVFAALESGFQRYDEIREAFRTHLGMVPAVAGVLQYRRGAQARCFVTGEVDEPGCSRKVGLLCAEDGAVKRVWVSR